MIKSALTSAILSFFFVLQISAAQQQTPPGRQQAFERLQVITQFAIPEWRFSDGDPLNAESTSFDDSTWKTYKIGDERTSGPAWFRGRVRIPKTFAGYSTQGSTLRIRLRIGGENPVHQTVYFNGNKVAEGNDLDPLVLTSGAQPGVETLIAIRADVPGGRTTFSVAQLELNTNGDRPDPRIFYQEALAADAMITGTAQGAEHASRLDAALQSLDWSSLERGDQRGFDHSLSSAHDKLRALSPWLKTFSIQATGNSHIDMAWLWPSTETVEVVRNTFNTVLRLMREYPDFTFTHSSAVTYAWMQEKYPKMFQEIEQRVKEGRWEPIGGMWVEPDLNMPDGESLVRQLLVGTRYFKSTFGKDIRIGWNPDSFGYNWQLPQIYKRSGMDFFVTQKLYWSDTTKFPYKLFWWEAPDGSRVLTYFPHDYGNPIEPVNMARDLAQYTTLTGIPQTMHLYGVGDHGGGPTRSMLATAHTWEKPEAIYPRLKLGTAQAFFDSLGPQLSSVKVPTWKDELYLEYHRGVYTSQANIKRDNRRNEELLLNAEKFSAFISLAGRKYPQDDLNYAWKRVLFNQFHDVMAGSAVAAVYADAAREHAEARRIGNEVLDGALAEIAARANTAGPGGAVLVINPLSWARTDAVEAQVQFPALPKSVVVRDARGRELLSNIVAIDPKLQRVTVRFIAQNVPPLGYEVVHIAPGVARTKPVTQLRATDDSLENEFVRLKFDRSSGCITSLFDKKSNREMLAPNSCGNLLQAFHDLPREYDAWNIDADYEKQRWDINKADEVKLTERGHARATVRVTRRFQHSTFVQDISISPLSARVDIHNSIEWHEQHVLIKAAFPLSVQNNFATYEIPYGSIQRPTTRNTPSERAKFEVPALRWADLSDATHGLSLLNDSKYGYDVRDNVLRLTLLRSPTYPDPHADQGHHEFTYSLYAHGGGWANAGTVQRGYELNYKLMTRVVGPHAGDLPAEYSFAALSPANLILTAVKKAEDDNAMIFRFYESAGRGVSARLHIPGVNGAVETNLMEKEERPLSTQNGEVAISVKPWEIKTVKVKFAAKP